MYALEDFARSERAVFVVETVTRAVRRGHVKLHEVDVLTHDVGRRAYLEVVEFVNVRCQVRVLERDAVVRVGTEEQWLGRTRAVQCRRNVVPQGQDSRLREVPA